MTADPLIRAQRRFKELSEKGISSSIEEIVDNIKKRDNIDENREESPLRKADDAILLDNSHLTPEQQMNWVMEKIENL
jgi:cytidylate kinase